MREAIGFEIVDFRNFDSLVTLTLTFDDLETYIVRFVSLISIHSIIIGRTYVHTYVRTDISSGFIRSSKKKK